MAEVVYVSTAVEGPLDAAVAERLIREAGAEPHLVLIRNGKAPLLQRAGAYNTAARFAPWLVLVDLDADHECAPLARTQWLASPSTHMCFRIAVREIEAWLLADRSGIASFCSIPVARVPDAPESLRDAKRAIVQLAALSGRRGIRDDMVPSPTSGRETGAGYLARMIEFAQSHWSPAKAAAVAPSLSAARACLGRVLRAAGKGPT